MSWLIPGNLGIIGSEGYEKVIAETLLSEEQARMVMQVVVWLIILVALFLAVRFVEKVVSKFLPEKTAPILIWRVSRNQAGNRRIQMKLTETGKKRTFFMPPGKYEEGQEGTLRYKGRYGVEFVAKPRQEQSNRDRYYRYDGRRKGKIEE